ncbi:MAG: YeeE/YedE family protein, partial [Bdellovibrionota bacterium]
MLIYTMPLLGGALIGIAVSLMLYLNGRITGVSGIVSRALIRKPGDTAWRLTFIVGLLVGGVILRIVLPETLISSLDRSFPALIVAGLLVGYGT